MIKSNNSFFSRVPLYIPNRIIYFGFNLISVLSGKVNGNVREKHRQENGEFNITDEIFNNDKYIENQDLWENVKFGSGKKSNMKYSGCTVIAVYNALLSLNDRNRNIIDLIEYFERKGAALKGDFGIAPSYAYKYFKKHGYDAAYITSRNSNKIRQFGKKYDTFIVNFYWDKRNIFNKLHTINISLDKNGFTAHNMYCRRNDGKYESSRRYDDLFSAVDNLGKRTAPIVIIGIRKRN